ncbi:MAG: ABC-three component system middle component 6 [Thermoanaerobaculia bacterium]
MILPNKYVSPRTALLQVGAVLLEELHHPRTVSELWERVRERSAIGSFQRFSLTLALLFALGALDFQGGLLLRSVPK